MNSAEQLMFIRRWHFCGNVFSQYIDFKQRTKNPIVLDYRYYTDSFLSTYNVAYWTVYKLIEGREESARWGLRTDL